MSSGFISSDAAKPDAAPQAAGTATPFAALSVLNGTVIGRYKQRHRHLEFIRFLDTVDRKVIADKRISTSSPIIMQSVNIAKCWLGWRIIRAGLSLYPDLGFLAQ